MYLFYIKYIYLHSDRQLLDEIEPLVVGELLAVEHEPELSELLLVQQRQITLHCCA